MPALADALWLGIAQACALLPGVSRNGATLAAARLRGFTREDANRLSRHVALPVIAGATLLKSVRLARRGLPPRSAAPVRARRRRVVRLDAGLDMADPAGGARPLAAPLRRATGWRSPAVVAAAACAAAPDGVRSDVRQWPRDRRLRSRRSGHAQADRGVAALVDVLSTIEHGARVA